MIAKVQKWGNGQGLRLEKQILENARISVGDDVEVIVEEGQIVIRKLPKLAPLRTARFDLAEMVSRMPDDYHVEEESFGKPVGKEAW